MSCNIKLYPWFKFFQSLLFWQATWFLYFESRLSAAEAVMMYVIYDLATTVFEVPSGYLSDRLGRRSTLITSAATFLASVLMLVFGTSFIEFVAANVLLGVAMALASGTDSALLFESLKAQGREKAVADAELKAWRFTFVASAISALSGGVLAFYNDVLPYVATATAGCATLYLAFRFQEPKHSLQTPHAETVRALAASFRDTTLLWLLVLTLIMYAVGHIPFVFAQPFIREALGAIGQAQNTPLASGTISFLMMMLSVFVSLFALQLRRYLGLTRILLLAFGMQVGLTAALATSNGLFVVCLLFLRMVPDSLSDPFIRARIQPLLRDNFRATYFSLQSLAGRIVFALALSWAASRSPDDAPLPYADLQPILIVFTVVGAVFWIGLLTTARRASVEGTLPETSANPVSSRS